MASYGGACRFDSLFYLESTVFLERRQRSLQYLTCSQSFFHFFRQVNGRSQTGQILVGSSDFFNPRKISLRGLAAFYVR